MKTDKGCKECIAFLTIRAVVVTIVVLVLLSALARFGITVKEPDLPVDVVEEQIVGSVSSEAAKQ